MNSTVSSPTHVSPETVAEIEAIFGAVSAEALVQPRLESAYEFKDVETAVDRELATIMLGVGAVGGMVEIDRDPDEHADMKSMILGAKQGDQMAANGRDANISTLISELTTKYGNVVTTRVNVDKQGNFYQFGQSMRSCILNTLRFRGRDATTLTEIRNILRSQEYVRRGILQPGGKIYELSIVRDGNAAELEQAGYFVESMSMVVRETALDDTGNITMSSYFVAGVDMDAISSEIGDGLDEGTIRERQVEAVKRRHDKLLMQQFFADEGIETSGDSSEHYLVALLDRNGRFENGALDIVRRLDEIASQVTGKNRFFGTNIEGYSYESFVALCKDRSNQYGDIMKAVVHEAEVRITERTPAGEVPAILRAIADKHLIRRSVMVGDIDARVFGAKAAGFVIAARREVSLGGDASLLVAHAIKASTNGDCPSAIGSSKEDRSIGSPSDPISGEAGNEDGENGACEYTIDCCVCSPYEDDGSSALKPYVVSIVRDGAGDATCKRCKACMDTNGEMKDPGLIAPRAKAKKQQEAE